MNKLRKPPSTFGNVVLIATHWIVTDSNDLIASSIASKKRVIADGIECKQGIQIGTKH